MRDQVNERFVLAGGENRAEPLRIHGFDQYLELP